MNDTKPSPVGLSTLVSSVTAMDYQTAIAVAKFVSIVGSVAVMAGGALFLYSLLSRGMALLGIPMAFVVSLLGLMLIVAGQVSRSTMDNANYSKQILEEMRKNNS